MKVLNYLGFSPTVKTASGEMKKLAVGGAKPIVANGAVTGLPEAKAREKVLVNGMVFNASNQENLVMFDMSRTIRDGSGNATAQGGMVAKDGSSLDFTESSCDLI